MPLQPLPMTKGLVSVDRQEIGTPEAATYYRNLIRGQSGAMTDRPGLLDFANIGSYAVLGLSYFKKSNTVVAVTNEGTDARKLWSITQAGVVTDITGTVLAGSSRPVFANDGDFLAIAGGGTPLTWAGTGTTTAMTGSPPSCTHIAYLDGYWLLHLLADQEIRWAGPTSAARLTWSSSNFFSAERLPDDIVTQAVLQREFYAFGRESTEIFQNFGASVTAPFSPTFFLESGTLSPYSLIKADNTLFWLDQNGDFVRMEGRTPVIISEDVAKDIKSFTKTDCFASHFKLGEGRHMIGWTFPTDERTFVYDYKNKEWSEWDTQINGLPDRLNINAHCYVPEWGTHLVGDPAIGKVYTLSPTTKVDGSYPLRRIRRMTIDWGTNARKRSNYYMFSVKRGVATSTVTNPVFQVRVNDDNKGWSEPKLIPLGATGSDTGSIRVRMGGIYRKRELEVSVTDACEFNWSGCSEDVDVMNS